MGNEGLYSVGKRMKKGTLKKKSGIEFCRSLVTWPESRMTHKIEPVKGSSNSSMCFSRGLFHRLEVVSQSRASRDILIVTNSSPNSHTQPLY